jgi:hypothetical protein
MRSATCAFVEVPTSLKPNVSTFCALEEADDLAVLGIRGIPHQSFGERAGAAGLG